jgi:hypothetical protein
MVVSVGAVTLGNQVHISGFLSRVPGRRQAPWDVKLRAIERGELVTRTLIVLQSIVRPSDKVSTRPMDESSIPSRGCTY